MTADLQACMYCYKIVIHLTPRNFGLSPGAVQGE